MILPVVAGHPEIESSAIRSLGEKILEMLMLRYYQHRTHPTLSTKRFRSKAQQAEKLC
jgi:hypothetical protein